MRGRNEASVGCGDFFSAIEIICVFFLMARNCFTKKEDRLCNTAEML